MTVQEGDKYQGRVINDRICATCNKPGTEHEHQWRITPRGTRYVATLWCKREKKEENQ